MTSFVSISTFTSTFVSVFLASAASSLGLEGLSVAALGVAVLGVFPDSLSEEVLALELALDGDRFEVGEDDMTCWICVRVRNFSKDLTDKGKRLLRFVARRWGGRKETRSVYCLPTCAKSSALTP